MSTFLMLVRHVMSSPVITIQENDSVLKAIKKMIDKDIECLVVSTADKRVSGILTFRDMVEKVLLLERPPKHARVGEIMTRKVKTCRSTATVGEVVKLMKKYRLRRIPVVDARERLVGIITNFDLACLGLEVST